MTAKRCLIVNADDFGQSRGINRGIMEAYEKGIVTSSSLMVLHPAAAEAAAYARGNPELSVGLHVDLGEWTCRNGAWTPVYTVIASEDGAAIEKEIQRQTGSVSRAHETTAYTHRFASACSPS